MSAFQIGQLVGVSGLVVMFAGPASGLLADKCGSESRVIKCWLFLAFVLTGAVYFWRKQFILLLVCYGSVSFFDKAISPLLDSWIVGCMGTENEFYGRLRAIGSLGGALCAVLTGQVLDRFGFETIFGIHMGMTAILFASVCFGKCWREEKKNSLPKRERKKSISGLTAFFPGKYPVLLLVLVVLFMGVSVEITYFPMLFYDCGGTAAQLGAAFFLMSISELTGMAFYGLLRKRISAAKLFYFSILAYVCKLGLQIFLAGVPGLTALQLLQGGTYGILLPAVTEIVPMLVPSDRRASALGLCFSCMQGIGMVLGNFLAGIICERSGLRSGYLAGTVFCFTASVLYGCVFKKKRRTFQAENT